MKNKKKEKQDKDNESVTGVTKEKCNLKKRRKIILGNKEAF